MLGPALSGRFPGWAGELVEGWWTVATSGSGLVVPDGAIDVMWSPGLGPWLAGPDTAPRSVDMAPGTLVVGVRLRPDVAPAATGVGADELADTLVPLSRLWSRAALAPLDDALGRIGQTPGPPDDRPSPAPGPETAAAAAAALLAGAVARRVPEHWRPDPLVAAAVHDLRAGRPFEPDGVGERQFRRRFARAMGYGPATYRRISRLSRFTDLAERWPERTVAELAVGAGYFDESHLARDTRSLLATTPARLRPTPRSAPVPTGS